MQKRSVKAPVNIAVIKYWGKRDKELNLPLNGSLSVTLSISKLYTLTSVACSRGFKKDRFWLNGREENELNERMKTCLLLLRSLRRSKESREPGLERLSEQYLHIVSENNFPTAAGLASSASGYAALIKGIAELYDLDESSEELSCIARQGSGSACRSLMGGFVLWKMGVLKDGSDSFAEQIASKTQWEDLRVLIIIVSSSSKKVSSTKGMQATVLTSNLFQHRIKHVDFYIKKMENAIKQKDFESFAELTMKDSNQFHATCLDTFPPVFYLNDTSTSLIQLIHEINRLSKKTIAAYTFDAGPNAVIYFLKENEDLLLGTLHDCLSNVDGWSYKYNNIKLNISDDYFLPIHGKVNKVIITEIGDGTVQTSESLINSNGYPIYNCNSKEKV
ncbi:diphosphomevalonate decarboxylase [Pneumocystis carinii B80]|uniref:Diphosphomevalonate decarboxylase n=1 Tax=Pneumocystis carinii (strain B80) TaxID=1408658 RepID=A0A0W4ZMW4_PNEC8|nr:diphosphomevalonate decarboxylase [Pneumocystis carinii B80]KTW29714.1 diphosphomevalonate decarboxylase [Pneumocystis carinii B80]